MSEMIDTLITDAGFSSTYERDRLQKLCQLSALACIAQFITTEDKTKCIAEIISTFDIKFDNHE